MFNVSDVIRFVFSTLVLGLSTYFWIDAIARQQMTNDLLLRSMEKHNNVNDTISTADSFPSASVGPADDKQQQQKAFPGGKMNQEKALTSAVLERPPELQQPNVLFLMCDDLNDYIETMGGHPQAITPNIRRLMDSSVTFTQAHSNIPLCKPSRCSFLSGIYPHTSKFLEPNDLPHPDHFVGLRHQRTMIEHFNRHGYMTMGTGKIYHGYKKSFWKRVGHLADYGPFVYNKTEANEKGANDRNASSIAHPAVPYPFRLEGPVRGSFGPLEKLEDDLGWRIGDFFHDNVRELEVHNDTHRDMTPDELSASWAVEQLQKMESAPEEDDMPFFLGVGLVRPHHPMVVSQKYFDMYPLETLQLPPSMLENDLNDTLRQTLEETGLGPRFYHRLLESYGGFRKAALRRYVQAYLASVTAADELLGKVLDALDQSRFKDDTIVVFTSDHGYQAGQKDYLGKNLLWQATTRVPLVVRVPGVTEKGTTANGEARESDTNEMASRASSPRTSDHPVTLIDLYPTLIDLCGLSNDTTKDKQSRPLEGHSLRPFLEADDDRRKVEWDGPDFALSALSYAPEPSDPIGVSLTTRYDKWRYIRYANGKEELYNTVEDPYEWTNLVVSNSSTHDVGALLKRFRTELFQFVKADGAGAKVA